MMSITIQCPGCKKTSKAKDDLAGKRARCPFCGQAIDVPAARLADASIDGAAAELPRTLFVLSTPSATVAVYSDEVPVLSWNYDNGRDIFSMAVNFLRLGVSAVQIVSDEMWTIEDRANVLALPGEAFQHSSKRGVHTLVRELNK